LRSGAATKLPAAEFPGRHLRYLRALTIPLAAHKAVLQEYLLAFEHGTNRVGSCMVATPPSTLPRWSMPMLTPPRFVPSNDPVQ
jgi:hypothetical protein